MQYNFLGKLPTDNDFILGLSKTCSQNSSSNNNAKRTGPHTHTHAHKHTRMHAHVRAQRKGGRKRRAPRDLPSPYIPLFGRCDMLNWFAKPLLLINVNINCVVTCSSNLRFAKRIACICNTYVSNLEIQNDNKILRIVRII